MVGCDKIHGSIRPYSWRDRPDLNEADDDPHRLARYTHQRLSGEVGALEYVGGAFCVWADGTLEPLAACVFNPFVNESVRLALEERHAARLAAWNAKKPMDRGRKPVMPKVTRVLLSDVTAALRGYALWPDGSEYVGKLPKGVAK